MPNKSKNKSPVVGTTPTAAPAASATQMMGALPYGLGTLALLAAAVASGMLAAEHLGWFGSGLPGCGVGSGCDKATSSVFGKLPFEIPGYGAWSVAFVGFAYFVSMLTAWLLVGRSVPRVVVWMARLGLLASLYFIGIIVMHRNEYVCKYCIASHASNLIFWACAEFGAARGSARVGGGLKAVLTAAAVFAASSVGLGAVEKRNKEIQAAKAEDNLQGEIAEMQAQAAKQAEDAAKSAAAQKQAPAPAPAAAKKVYPPVDIGVPIPTDDTLAKEGFTGRYRLGPAQAPIRLVVFSDYQCKDCARVEKELHQLLKEKPQISYTAKQWAFNNECNKYMDRAMHANACWAARAAEAAGILRGNEGFWQMHFWLFDRMTNGQPTPGAFTDAELDAGLVEMGYDPAEFKKVMTGPETLALVKKDIDEGYELGLLFTPMIFVNGKEFRGWTAVEGLRRYIEAMEKLPTPLPAQPATVDVPAGKGEKYLADWQTSPRVSLARNGPMWGKGPQGAKIRVVVFGDYRDNFTQDLWKSLVTNMAGRDDVAVDFRDRPVNETCQLVGVPDEQMPACRMARAAEAAGRIGGLDAYWKMHDWLMKVGAKYTEAMLPEGAAAAGVDLAKLKADMATEDVLDLVSQNNKVLQRVGARGVPALFVNERYVWRWKLDEQTIIAKVFEEAAAGR